MTVLIGIGFMLYTSVLGSWALAGVFFVITIAGAVSYPAASRAKTE